MRHKTFTRVHCSVVIEYIRWGIVVRFRYTMGYVSKIVYIQKTRFETFTPRFAWIRFAR